MLPKREVPHCNMCNSAAGFWTGVEHHAYDLFEFHSGRCRTSMVWPRCRVLLDGRALLERRIAQHNIAEVLDDGGG